MKSVSAGDMFLRFVVDAIIGSIGLPDIRDSDPKWKGAASSVLSKEACFESDPTSVSANAVGIAGIVLNCLDSSLQNITKNIANLLLSKKDKDDVKTALEACKKELSMAATKLSEAKTNLKNGDYDKTNLWIKFALGEPLRCRTNLKKAKFTSLGLFSQIDSYGQLSEAAMRIIDRF